MSNFLRILFIHIAIFLGIYTAALGAQELPRDRDVEERSLVAEVVFEVTGGNTREQALRRWVIVDEGQMYETLGELESQVARDKQELINLRVFESVETVLEPLPATPRGIPWRVTFRIQDAWTFIPIPLVLYDSNEGLQVVYIQIWDNMFGTLTNWFSLTSFSFRRDNSGRVELGPWQILPIIDNIRINGQTYGVRFEQEYAEKKRYESGSLISEYSYYRTALAVSTEYRFGEKRRWYYTVAPGAEARYGYEDRLGAGGFDITPFTGLLNQSFFYDSVDFVGNSRRGFRMGVESNVKGLIRNGNWDLVVDAAGEMAPYLTAGRFSYYARLSGLYVYNDEYEDLGEPLRGIPDSTMFGYAAAYLNQTIGIDVWHWKGVFDLQVHPFYDVGFAVNKDTGTLDWGDIRQSAGADILLFVDNVPNLAFRFSWGFDLDPAVSWDDPNKTEFIVRYSFSY